MATTEVYPNLPLAETENQAESLYRGVCLKKKCPMCNGVGMVEYRNYPIAFEEACSTCKGSGSIIQPMQTEPVSN
jgi:DnaJ-class molecular chaperone